MSGRSRLVIVLLVVVAALVFAGMSMNIATDMVREKIVEGVRESLDSEVEIGSVQGNPFKGYTAGDILLSADGREILSAERVKAKISIVSFLTGSAPVSLLEISGFNSDVESMNRLLPKIKTGEGGGEIPIKELRIVDSSFGSEWAEVGIEKVALAFDGQNVGTELDVMVKDIPLKGEVDLSMEPGSLSLREMDLAIGEGRLSASGSLTPELGIEGNIKGLDISKLVSLWPEARPENYQGLFSTDFAAEGTWRNPNIMGNLSFDGKMVSGIPVEDVTARWRYSNNRLDVAEMDVQTLGFPLKGNLAFVFDPSTPARMLVDLQGSVTDLAVLSRVSDQLKDISGTLDNFKVYLEGDVLNPSGEISFESEKLGYQDISISNTSINARIENGNADVSGKSMYEGASVAFEGTVSDFIQKPLVNIKGTLRSFSLESAEPFVPAITEAGIKGTVNADYKITGSLPDIAASGKIWSERLIMGDYSISGPSTFFEFADDSLAFSDLKATWKKAAISGNGTVKDLTTEKRSGDMTFKASDLDPAFFASFYPPIEEYGLEGKITLEATLKGALTDPSVRVSLISPALSVMDSYSFRNISAGTSISSLGGGVPSDLDLDLKADRADLAGISFGDLDMGVQKRGKVISINKGKASLGGGTISLSGSVTTTDPFDQSALDLAVKAARVDLQKIVIKGQEKPPVAGVITADASVRGVVANPELSVKATAPFVAASGMRADSFKLDLSGNMEKMKIENLSGQVGEGSIAVIGDIRPAPFAADLVINGQNLDLKPMTSRFKKLEQFDIKGAVDLVFNGHFENGKNSGTGKVTSPSVSFMDIKVNDITLPLELKGDTLVSSKGTGKLYGGSIVSNGSLNIGDMSFNEQADVADTDIDALLRDAFDLKGHVTGKAQVNVKITGFLGENMKYNGRGLLKTGSGAISGFKAIDVIAAVHGARGINYASVYAPFDIKTGTIVLKEDTVVKAPENDPLYRHFSASGPIGPQNRLDLDCRGKVNVKVVNALLGGAAGGLASAQDIAGTLKGILEGASGQMRQDDFRDISMKVKGTFQKPSVSNFKMSSPEVQPDKGAVEELKTTETSPVDQFKEKAMPKETAPSEETSEKKELEDKLKDEIRNIFN
jgi:hypothetical protein